MENAHQATDPLNGDNGGKEEEEALLFNHIDFHNTDFMLTVGCTAHSAGFDLCMYTRLLINHLEILDFELNTRGKSCIRI